MVAYDADLLLTLTIIVGIIQRIAEGYRGFH